ncbi:SH3 domain-containing protein C23A1.17-like [Simochromis diagramma]|uniref:SH3 domain-containing protein C23A1.17-like n=1 Tax=Simochromis diagramma TaxID=43689 RepID=UPI001A7EBC94|nr:SH3 domain-containing protein C23A1.17-like [Simochromis diagramma]
MDPADSALTECLEETARIQAILDRIFTAPDLKSKLVMVNVAEAIMERDPRLLQLPGSPAIVDAFTRVKLMLQAQELSSQEMASSTYQSQQPHDQSSSLLPPEPECVRVGSLRFAAASPPLSSPVSTPSSQSHHTPATVQREEALDTIDLDHDERQSIFCALLEEELRWKPWLIPEHEPSFRGTRLALGGPRSYQGLPPIAPPSSTLKKKRRARHRRSTPRTQVSDYILAPRVFSPEIIGTDTAFPGHEPGYDETVFTGNASHQAQLSCCGTAIQAGLELETEVQLVQPISVSAGGPGEPVRPHVSFAGGSGEPSQLHVSSAGGSGEPSQLHVSSAGGPEEPVRPPSALPPVAPVPPPAGPPPAASAPQPEDDASPGSATPQSKNSYKLISPTIDCVLLQLTQPPAASAGGPEEPIQPPPAPASLLPGSASPVPASASASALPGPATACASPGPASASASASPVPASASASASSGPATACASPGSVPASAPASPGSASASASASVSPGPASASAPASPSPGPASASAPALPGPATACASPVPASTPVSVSASPGSAVVLLSPEPRFAPRDRRPLSGPSAGLHCRRGRPPESLTCDLLCSRPSGRPPELVGYGLLDQQHLLKCNIKP